MQDSTIRYRPDGSIDTAFYMAIGRRKRSEAAHDLAGAAKHRTAGLLSRLGDLIRLVRAARGAGARA